MGKEIELIGYCGLYCGDCIRYRSKPQIWQENYYASSTTRNSVNTPLSRAVL